MHALRLDTARALLRRWTATLKFKIVALCLLAALGSAGVTTSFILVSTQKQVLRLLLDEHAGDMERSASLLSSKIDMLHTALRGVAVHVRPELLGDREALTRYLQDKPALGALFDAVFIADRNGVLLARLQRGVPRGADTSIADREYFVRTLQTGQPVVSKAMIGRISRQAITVLSLPVKAADGSVIAVLGGSINLQSKMLLSLVDNRLDVDGARTLVIDTDGRILSHPDASRVLQSAETEPGFTEAYKRWVDNGRTVHSEGNAMVDEGHMVAMAGSPAAEWMLVRLTPESEALRPLIAGRASALRAGASVGLATALIAAMLALLMTRPITRLRLRAERLIATDEVSDAPWPRDSGEVGALSSVFQHVLERQQLREEQTRRALVQLQAALDNAAVGIAFTRNSQFEMVSQRFAEILGWDKSALEGLTTRAIYASDEARDALVERARPAFQNEGAFEGELTLARRSGETFWAHMRGRAVVPGEIDAGTIWIIEDVTHAHEQRERLTWTATHDALTGLVNRATFDELLGHATAQAVQHPFCALFIDLDRFKQVNDTAGHAAGDMLLRELALQFGLHVRQSDTVARLGGDEFAVLLHRCPAPKAASIAETMRAAVEAYRLVWEGKNFSVGASIGLVYVDAGFGSRAEVLRAADAACYAAKRAGRNQVSVHVETATAVAEAAPTG